jgi:hypothetical protein
MLKCSDKVRPADRDSAGRCFQKGIKVGFAAGIRTVKKETARQKKKTDKKVQIKVKAVEAAVKAILNKEFLTLTLNQAPNDILKIYARQKGVTNYRNKNREQIIKELKEKGVEQVKIPR